jgi:branched-chain amino acid transport system permease protein
LGGILLGASETVQWDMGFKLLLLIFAAVVLGGLGTAFGAMVGAFIVGITVEMSTFWIDANVKNAVALALLVVMLLIRPQGILGTKERIG